MSGRPSLRRGLPYRWWASEAGTLALLVLMLAGLALALAGAWLRWWGA